MTRLALALAVLAMPVAADPVTLSIYAIEGDTAALEMDGAWFGVLTYENNAAQHSQTGSWPVSAESLTCRIHIVVGDAEKARVTCPEGWSVHPERAEVPDGEILQFILTYQGM